MRTRLALATLAVVAVSACEWLLAPYAPACTPVEIVYVYAGDTLAVDTLSVAFDGDSVSVGCGG